MATITKSWSTKGQIIGTSDGYVVQTSSYAYSSGVDLQTNGYEAAHVIVEADFAATPTDDLDVTVFGSLDGTDFDDVGVNTIRIDNATDPAQISLIVHDLAYFRIGTKQTGSTDSHSARCYVNAWRWDST